MILLKAKSRSERKIVRELAFYVVLLFISLILLGSVTT